MKKTIVLCTVLLCTFTHTFAAEETEGQSSSLPSKKFYVGVHLSAAAFTDQETSVSGIVVESSDFFNPPSLGVGLHVGGKFNENVGLEIGYLHHPGRDKFIRSGDIIATSGGNFIFATRDTTNSVSVHNFYADVVGYLPVANIVNLLGSVGTTFTRVNWETSTSEGSESDINFRIGGGAEIYATDYLSFKVMAHYQTFEEVYDGALSLTGSISYHF